MNSRGESADPAQDASFRTLTDVLRARADRHTGRDAYAFLTDGEDAVQSVTYGALDRRARTLATRILDAAQPGDRALLLYPPGIEYIAAFFGCLYAGVIAVPAYPPLRARGMGRVDAMVAACGAKLALTTEALKERIAGFAGARESFEWIATDGVADREDARAPSDADPASIAFLQFTSGSTGDPKGVMVSHANLIANQEMIRRAFRLREDSVIVGWLPLYHDMGLIGNVFQPLYLGASCVLMSPVHFLQRPVRWLRAISKYRGTVSGGPDFAYDLVARRIRAEELAELDLRAWEVAFNGAEPVRAETLDRFAEVMAPAGFHAAAFQPCYGLAEATLIASGGRAGEQPAVLTVSAGALEAGRVAPANEDERARRLVGSGRVPRGGAVAIVDPDSLRRVAEDAVAEIWIAGPHVAQGYWGRRDATAAAFAAEIASEPGRGYLRTGDLGFIRGGEVFVCGRLKDLIIVRGRNVYPQDIERIVEQSHPALRPSASAAFAVETPDGEGLVIVQEIDARRRGDAARAAEAAARAVAAELEVQPYAVVIVAAGGVPRTTSGKVRRRECRALFERGALEAEFQIQKSEAALDAGPDDGAFLDWLIGDVARRVGTHAGRIDPSRAIADFGLDSMTAIAIIHAVFERSGVEVPMARLLEDMSFVELADHVACGASAELTVAPPDGGALSAGEQALWFLQDLDPGSSAYNLALAVRARGDFDARLFRRVMNDAVAAHPALRSRFTKTGDGPRRRIAAASADDGVEFLDTGDAARDAGELEREVIEFALRPYDLTSAPLVRAGVFRLADDDVILVIGAHHVAVDLWSATLLMDELKQRYAAALRGDAPPVVVDAFDPGRRAALEARYLDSSAAAADTAFWSQELSGELPILDLPGARPATAASNGRGSSLSFEISADLSREIKALARHANTTLFTVTLAAFQVLLHRMSGQEEVIVGTPSSGRHRPGLAGAVGYFVNTLPVRADFGRDPGFRAFLDTQRRRILNILQHQDLPFVRIVEALGPSRGGLPVFRAMFACEHAATKGAAAAPFLMGVPGARFALLDVELSAMELAEVAAPFDLTLNVVETDDGLAGTLIWMTDVLDEAAALSLIDGYEAIVRSIVQRPDDAVSRLAILSPAARRQYIEAAAAVRFDAGSADVVHELFTSAASLSPDAVALIAGENSITYRDLDLRSNKLARVLQSRGARAGTRVGVLMGRSIDMVTALIAVMKTGAAYVPLDPDHPAERLALIVEDARLTLLVAGGAACGATLPQELPVIFVDGESAVIGAASGAPLDALVSGGDVCYLIFTSGSTGRPKGVEVLHRSVANLLASMAQEPGLDDSDTVVAVTTISFDIAVLEIFLPLLNGARCVLADRETVRDGARLVRLLDSVGATFMQATPSLWRALFDRGWTGRANLKALSGGEALPRDLAARLAGAVGELWNVYGPTETTIWSMAARIHPDGDVVLGDPVANTEIHILDDALEPVPAGVAGEIFIGGAGLARGYFHRPDLTAQTFIPHPFRPRTNERLYRTGDLARRRRDGEIEFLGRRDQQVKVRGFRVELGEIEAVIAALPDVRHVVVISRASGGAAMLAAFVARRPGAALDAAAVRARAATLLPDYMVPAAVVFVDRLPLTPSGKIDRRALMALPLDVPRSGAPGADVLSPNEDIVAGVWAEVLGGPRPGKDLDFFAAGGHSLLAVRVASRLGALAGREIEVRAVFDHPTVRRLAAHVFDVDDRREAAAIEPVRVAQRSPEMPASFTQERLWFIDQMEQGSAFYNISTAIRLDGDVDDAALKASFEWLARRHEALRTSFVLAGGRPVQVIAPEVEIDFNATTVDALDLKDVLERNAREPFDLGAAPLWRTRVLRAGAGALVQVTIHHIIADGWSLHRMVRDAGQAYRAIAAGRQPELSAPCFQFADFAAWQREAASGPRIAAHVEAWRSVLAGAPPFLDLPVDDPRPIVQTYRGARADLSIDRATARAIAETSRAQGVTPFMLLLAAYRATLHAWSGAEDIVIGSPVAGRSRPEFEDTVGCFLNTVALRSTMDGAPALSELLRRERRAVLEAFAIADAPFDRLVDELDVERDPSRAPVFQALFTLQVPETLPEEIFGRRASFESIDTGAVKFDVMLDLALDAEKGGGALIYNRDLFRRESMSRVADLFLRFVRAFAMEPERRLDEVEVASSADRAAVLEFGCPAATGHPFRPLPRRVEEQARRTPGAAAVRFGSDEITYQDLDLRAARAVAAMSVRGIGKGDVVGIMLPRSIDMVTAMLGVMKAGAAYLCFDPSHPDERRRRMMEIANVRLVIGSEDLPLGAGGDVAEGRDLGETDLAYIVFTSGSTGNPKGVMAHHGGVANYMNYLDETFALGPGDVVLQVPPPTFDASVRDIFGTLSRGATLVILKDEEAGDPVLLAERIAGCGVTAVLSIVPTLLGAVVDAAAFAGLRFESLRLVVASGEVLHGVLVDRLRALGPPGLVVVNQYGPTECTMTSTYHVVGASAGDAGRVLIGRPIPGARVYVRDRFGRPSPPGFPGEISIGGKGVALGYTGDPAATGARFVPDPFAAHPEARMYRTGDRGRYRSDGALEFGGRMDDQLKIRGVRVEPGEVEAALKHVEGVHDAACVATARRGETTLVAYVVPAGGAALDAAFVKAALRRSVPEFMVPGAIVVLDVLPRLANGKLDRKRLPQPVETVRDAPRERPSTVSEQAIAAVWTRVLGVPEVGVHDNFFDLGGHSLSSIEAIAGVREQLGVRLAPRELMFQTLGQLAALCDERRTAGAAESAKGRLQGLKERLRGAFKRGESER